MDTNKITIEEALENLAFLMECAYVDKFEDDEKEALRMGYEALKQESKILEQKPSDDAISRDAACSTTICDGISCNECSFNTCEDGQSGCLLIERISKLPPVTPQPRTGYWIERISKATGHIEVVCSECGAEKHQLYDEHCGHCGTQMEYDGYC